jgi:hypothetical protein
MGLVSRDYKCRRSYIISSAIDIAAPRAHNDQDRNARSKRPGLPSDFIAYNRPDLIQGLGWGGW